MKRSQLANNLLTSVKVLNEEDVTVTVLPETKWVLGLATAHTSSWREKLNTKNSITAMRSRVLNISTGVASS